MIATLLANRRLVAGIAVVVVALAAFGWFYARGRRAERVAAQATAGVELAREAAESAAIDAADEATDQATAAEVERIEREYRVRQARPPTLADYERINRRLDAVLEHRRRRP